MPEYRAAWSLTGCNIAIAQVDRWSIRVTACLHQPFASSASGDRIAAMEWAIAAFFAVMLGLYIWSHVTAGHAIGKKVEPFIDDVFGVGAKTGQNPTDKDQR